MTQAWTAGDRTSFQQAHASTEGAGGPPALSTMNTLTAPAALGLAVLLSPALASEPVEQPPVHTRIGRIQPGAWPATIPASVRARAEWVLPIAEAIEGRVDIEEEGRVILVTTKEREGRARRRSAWVRRTLNAFEEALPFMRPTQVPEHAHLDLLRDRLNGAEDRTVIVIGCEPEQRGEVLALLGDRGCAPERTDAFGFDDSDQFVSLWVEEPAGAERWDDGNALVHHLGRALLAERYGRLPEWFVEGFATWLEGEVTGDWSALPSRPLEFDRTLADGFERELRDLYRANDARPFDFEGLAAWTAEGWDPQRLADACGLVGFLAEHSECGLAPFVANLGMRADIAECQVRPDGSVERVPGLHLSPADQRAVLEDCYGESVLQECATAFRRGSRYRPARG